MTAHEDLGRRQEIHRVTDRAFGLTIAGVCLLFALWPLLRGGPTRNWPLAACAAFLLAALVSPRLLGPLHSLWARLGMVLHRIVNPVVMGLVFFLAVTPTGWILRLLKKDLLRLRFEPDLPTYWNSRQPPGPPPETMINQF